MKRVLYGIMGILLLLSVSVCFAQSDNVSGDGASLYNEALAAYRAGNFYTAHQLFIQSQYSDWEQMAENCIQPWPKNGQVWRDPNLWIQDTKMTFTVNQPEDSAVFFRIYRGNNLAFTVFVGGPDTVSIMIPGGAVYTIRDGVGWDWYGPTETFGADGAYETMTFGKNESTSLNINARYEYKFTLDVESVSSGDRIGSQSLEWEDF